MCGIVGVAGDIKEREKAMFRDMLLFDVVRGQDSTGIASVPLGPEAVPSFYKDVGPPTVLWDDYSLFHKKFSPRGTFIEPSKFLLGHNRAATVGSVTAETAHPFNFGDVTGVHNGTLWYTKGLEGKHEVDSMQVFDTINAKGIDHTWKNLYGAAALVWWDESTGTFFVIRNDERELYFCYSRDGKTIFWASEAWMIEVAASRQSVPLRLDKDDKEPTIGLFKPGELYEFKPTSFGVAFLGQRKLEDAPSRTRVESYSHRFGYGNIVGYKGPNESYNKDSETRGDHEAINKTWARGLQKGNKDLRGKEFSFRAAIKALCSDTKENKYYLVGELVEDGTRVEVFPPTIGEWKKFAEIKNRNPTGKIIYRLDARPRVTKSRFDKTKSCYRIDSHYTTLVRTTYPGNNCMPNRALEYYEEQQSKAEKSRVVYPFYKNEMLNESDFIAALSAAGQSCVCCGEVFTVSDAENITWVNKETCLCRYCADKEEIRSYLGGY